jgi:hypothetical protein
MTGPGGGGIMHVPVWPAALERRRAADSDAMAWLFLLSSLFWPRLFLLGFWLFGSTLGDAFSSSAIPIIGFFVAPWTTVGYAFMWSITSESVNGWEWIVVAFCIALDAATYAGAGRLIRR